MTRDDELLEDAKITRYCVMARLDKLNKDVHNLECNIECEYLNKMERRQKHFLKAELKLLQKHKEILQKRLANSNRCIEILTQQGEGNNDNGE